MMMAGIIEIDLHGMNLYQAKISIDNQLHKANGAVYRVRLIHGYRGGTEIKNMIWEEYSYGRHPKVMRIQEGNNQGITELVLRELS